MIDTIIELIENDDMKSFLLFLEDVFPYMEKYEYEQLRQRVVEKLSMLLSDDTVGTVSDRALLLDYRAVLEKKPSKAIQYENRAIAMITEINAGNAALVSNLYTNLGTFYQNSGNIELAVESMESAIQIAKDYNIVESHDNIVRINNYASLLVDSGQPYRALWVLNNLCSLIKSYYSDKSIDYAITQERMGRFYSYLGDKRKAYIHFKTAFDIYCIHFEAEPEKIEYQYFVGKKKVYMPPSEAEKHGYERVNKYPKSTRFGRQNPIAARWNSDEQLVIWREHWAHITNKYLDEANRSDSHIDHRSHAARGLDEQPTIHEGYVARTIEQKGSVADRCAINRQIKADNALLRELKTAMKKNLAVRQKHAPCPRRSDGDAA